MNHYLPEQGYQTVEKIGLPLPEPDNKVIWHAVNRAELAAIIWSDRKFVCWSLEPNIECHQILASVILPLCKENPRKLRKYGAFV